MYDNYDDYGDGLTLCPRCRDRDIPVEWEICSSCKVEVSPDGDGRNWKRVWEEEQEASEVKKSKNALNGCINTLVKDAFEVESVTYDADIEINFDTNYITIRAIDAFGRTMATVSFHRYKDASILMMQKWLWAI